MWRAVWSLVVLRVRLWCCFFGEYVVHDGLGLDSTDANVPCIVYACEWYVMHAVCAICVGCECGYLDFREDGSFNG